MTYGNTHTHTHPKKRPSQPFQPVSALTASPLSWWLSLSTLTRPRLATQRSASVALGRSREGSPRGAGLTALPKLLLTQRPHPHGHADLIRIRSGHAEVETQQVEGAEDESLCFFSHDLFFKGNTFVGEVVGTRVVLPETSNEN